MPKPLIVANWKMNLDLFGIKQFFTHLTLADHDLGKASAVVCPSFIFLDNVRQLIGERPIGLGVQNVSVEERGPHTGEVGAFQLAGTGCQYVIIGHSERRIDFGETDAAVNRKIQLALRYHLQPIACLGENLREKEAGLTKKVLQERLGICLEGLRNHEMKHVTIAYEPMWAISTSPENFAHEPAVAEEVQVIHKYIRRLLEEMFDASVAKSVRVIYGGSVTPDDVAPFAAMDDIDGALIGGASKEAGSFQKIIQTFIS